MGNIAASAQNTARTSTDASTSWITLRFPLLRIKQWLPWRRLKRSNNCHKECTEISVGCATYSWAILGSHSNSNSEKNRKNKTKNSKNDKYNPNDNKRPMICPVWGEEGHRRGGHNWNHPSYFAKKRWGDLKDKPDYKKSKYTQSSLLFQQGPDLTPKRKFNYRSWSRTSSLPKSPVVLRSWI